MLLLLLVVLILLLLVRLHHVLLVRLDILLSMHICLHLCNLLRGKLPVSEMPLLRK